MNLNEFTNDRLPFQSGEVIPRDCTKHEIPMGAVPDEKDNTNPVPYMDKIFAAGGEQPTPVGPKDNEIWYTTTDGEIYDLGGIIEMVASAGGTYNGPAVVSNEYDEEKQMYCITFDRDVTLLGDASLETMTVEGPIFITNPKYGLVCNVETIILPESVNRIGDLSFYSCASLTSINIPNSVTSVGWLAFADCDNLPVIDNIRYADTYLVEAVDKTLSSYTIKDSTRFIGQNAFRNCSGLASVIIPDSVTSIGQSAFYGCSSLTSVIIPDSVTSIERYAFQECISLTYITIPNSVTSIESYTFGGCNSLTSVTIPDSVISIGNDAFNNCSGLTGELVIPNSVTSIGNEAFTYCSGLTSVTIPDSVTSIGYSAFYSCSSLTSVTIPNSITSIDSYAFSGCTGLTSITCEATTPASIGNDVFINTNNCPIYVPAESVDAYKTAENWSTYADRIQFER